MFNNVGNSVIMEERYSTDGLTIPALFDLYYGEGLPPDPSPQDIRERMMFLGKMYAKIEYERTISRRVHGVKQIGIFNNLRSMLDKQIKITQDINISICNEKRTIDYAT